MQNNFADPYAGLPNHGDVPPLPNGEIDLGPEAEAQLAKGQNPPDSVSGMLTQRQLCEAPLRRPNLPRSDKLSLEIRF